MASPSPSTSSSPSSRPSTHSQDTSQPRTPSRRQNSLGLSLVIAPTPTTVWSASRHNDDDDNVPFSSSFPQNAIERQAFTAPDFDADAFLSSRRHLGLDELKSELSGHLAQLKNELVELINRDYADFINLSTNLKGVDKVIEELRRPLDVMREEVKVVRSNLQAVISDLEAKLLHRNEIREKKACLQLLLNIHDSVSKVEDLLQINGEARAHTAHPQANGAAAVSVENGTVAKRIVEGKPKAKGAGLGEGAHER
ncbi:oligomeric golgi complex component, COG2-domain-containing protein [Jimgerdemannia flammicorona]|uniref:Oligomeric golgi complex component, COG2-domain-containing protein n=2 Tax=Jimgerdemannia flammicorona TaxID=994334 RepID=A0A433PKG8_9FUNG|nr:oligomeric golgi complex component, COG2-domain-containing protein [Jimgerdemannia flammicorona]RUS17950.1 oligomeric golgi complex component, COG2-domain-containing protein [Jimgerdemannia flammicorona]